MNKSGQPKSEARLGRHARTLNPRQQPMLLLAIAGLVGSICDRHLEPAPWIWLFLCGLAAASCLFARKNLAITQAATLTLAASSFGFYHHRIYGGFQEDSIAQFISEEWTPTIVEATVETPIERRPDTLAQERSKSKEKLWQSLFEVEIVSIRDGMDKRSASGRVRVVVTGVTKELLVGDLVQLNCRAQKIPPPSNPGELDLKSFYRSQKKLVRIHTSSAEHVRLITRGQWTLRRAIAWFGDRGQQALVANIGEDVAPLAEALVLGRRQAVDRAVRDRLLETGTIHLLAVSGLHVGIIAVAVTWLTLLLGMPRSLALSTVILMCVGYMVLTGSRPPVMRAATLISLFLIGRLLGHRVDPLNTLAAAGFILMVTDPLSIFQIGTHLSFLAVTTIILSGTQPIAPAEIDPLDELLQSRWAAFVIWLKNKLRSLYMFVRMSFWIWAIGLPLVWYHFHIVCPISIAANVLLWIPLTIALISALVTSVLGGIWSPLGYVPGKVATWALTTITSLVETMASVEGGHFWLPSPPLAMVIGFYSALLLCPLLISQPYRKRILLIGLAVWCFAAAQMATSDEKSDSFTATFIDVGHGTSVLMQFPTGENWLYDAGRLGDPVVAKWPIEAVLWSEGIRQLDGVIVSHSDADHYNAIVGLTSRFKIGKVIGSRQLFDSDDSGIATLLSTLNKSNIPIETLCAGEIFHDSKHVQVTALHPPPQHIEGSDNANSIVLQIECYGRSILLPGDLEDPGTEMILEQPPPTKGGVLMAPHHGSLSQDLYPILTWSAPSVVIASGGKRAAHPRVIDELGETGAEVFVTERDGAVRVTITESSIKVATWRRDPW